MSAQAFLIVLSTVATLLCCYVAWFAIRESRTVESDEAEDVDFEAEVAAERSRQEWRQSIHPRPPSLFRRLLAFLTSGRERSRGFLA